VSNSADKVKHDLECLRLASDLMQLSRETSNPDLQAHCARMSAYWVERADSRPQQDPASAIDSQERYG
jgi:hypothetical protein